jgi:hypothetical protein
LTPVTALYAALLSVVYVGLALRVVRLRTRLRISLGDGGDRRLARAVRVHAHFAEYVPLALLLMLLLELDGTPAAVLHGYGLLLLIARIVHAAGVSAVSEDLRWRAVGMVCTFTLLTGAAAALIAGWLMRG